MSANNDQDGADHTGKGDKKYKNKDFTNQPRKDVGTISELRHHMFTIGEKNSATKYITSRQAIGNYCGTTFHKDMRTLVVDGRDVEPKQPERPKPKTSVATRAQQAEGTPPEIDPFDMREYDRDYDQYKKKLERHDTNKGHTIVVILGQCTKKLTNKLILQPTDQNIYDSNDVVGLLNLIKKLVDTNDEAEYECQKLLRVLHAYTHIDVKHYEDVPSCEQRIQSAFDACTNQWGKIVPAKLPNGETEETFTEKLKAHICIRGADKTGFKNLLKEPRSNHVTGAGTYPATFSKAIAMLDEADTSQEPKPKPKQTPSPHPRREETSNAQTSTEDDSSQRRSVTFGRPHLATGAFQQDPPRKKNNNR